MRIEGWITCGVVASLAWGVYVLLLKVATSKRYHNVPPSRAFGVMSLGIFGVALITFLVMGADTPGSSLTGAGIALLSGVIWGVGMLCITVALSSTSTSVAKLVPLYNTNTLVATALGVLFLNEVPEHVPMVTAGALLVVLGGVLLTRNPSSGLSFKLITGAGPGKAKANRIKLEMWIIYGLIASFAWGSYALLLKVATTYYGCDPFAAFLAIGFGVLIVSSIGLLFLNKSGSGSFSGRGYTIALASGIIWAIGIFAVIYALSSLRANVASLVPLYNTNTLVAVFLGMLVFREVPEQRLITVLGAILIVLGGAIVAAV